MTRTGRKPNVKAMPSAKPRPEFKRYGCPHELGSQVEYSAWALATRAPMSAGAPRRLTLFKTLADTLMPRHFEWHDWTERMLEPLLGTPDCSERKVIRLVGFAGCASASKTYNLAGFAALWWACWPEESSVTFVSTTVKSLRRRGWAELQRAFEALRGYHEGNFVDSRMLWQSRLGDDKNAIIGRAVEEGSLHKIADDIKGVHSRRQLLIIDEATSVPEAIYEASANLFSYPEEFIMVCIGNPRNKLDAFGRFCEPKDGWTSVSVETEEWEAKPFEACGGECPLVVRFDAEKSPNITQGKVVSRHLPTKESVDRAKAASGGQTPHYWQNFRGFWPNEGLLKVVFTESALIKFDGYGKHKFTGTNFRIIGAFDPAYTSGGDRAALRFAKMGEVEGKAGRMGIELMPPIIIPVDAHSTNPVHYQLAEQLKRECEKVMVGPYEMHCPPENLCVDDTGSGGLCDVLNRIWSPRVHRVEFGSTPSEEPCSLEDVRPAKDVYRNKRAEIFFRMRGILDSGQLRGVDQDTAQELVSIQFDDSKTKTVLMPKAEYKAQFGKSCDLADCCCMISEIARIKGFQLAALGETEKYEEVVSQQFKAQQEMFEGVAYVDEVEEEPKQGVMEGVPAIW